MRMIFRIKYNLLLLLLFLISIHKCYGADVSIDVNSINPTYIQLCHSGSSHTIVSADIYLYNWTIVNDTDATRSWQPMTAYTSDCYSFGVSGAIHLIFIPASLRLTDDNGETLVMNKIISSDTTTVYTHPDFDDPAPTNIPPDNLLSDQWAGMTYFALNGGACRFGDGSPSALPAAYQNYYTAVNDRMWGNADHCGECVEIENLSGLKREFMVVDYCPYHTDGTIFNPCSELAWQDISQTGFDELANVADGVAQIKWKFVQCSNITGNIKYKFESWGADYHFEVQLYNHRSKIEELWVKRNVDSDTSYVQMNRGSITNNFKYGSSNSNTNLICPCTFKIVDSYGQIIIDTNAIPDILANIDRAVYLDSGVQFAQVNAPTPIPTTQPTPLPTVEPGTPSRAPTDSPTISPTPFPTPSPTITPITTSNKSDDIFGVSQNIFTAAIVMVIIIIIIVSCVVICKRRADQKKSIKETEQHISDSNLSDIIDVGEVDMPDLSARPSMKQQTYTYNTTNIRPPAPRPKKKKLQAASPRQELPMMSSRRPSAPKKKKLQAASPRQELPMMSSRRPSAPKKKKIQAASPRQELPMMSARRPPTVPQKKYRKR